MSRNALCLLIAIASAGPAAAQAPAAPDPVTDQQEELRGIIFPPCPRPVGGEIVVCGRREAEEQQAHRLPLAVGPTSSSADRAGGEQRAALAADSSRCTTVGRDQRCTQGLDVIGIGATIARGLAQALRGRD